MSYGKKREEDNNDNEDEVAIALVAECHVGEKTFKAGETWTDPQHDCRMSICNPGGVISYLECPHFELEEGDEIRIPGDNKYAYPHCCDYVFRTKKKKKDVEEEREGDKSEEREREEGEREEGGREEEGKVKEGREEGGREEGGKGKGERDEEGKEKEERDEEGKEKEERGEGRREEGEREEGGREEEGSAAETPTTEPSK